jgi:hypothetical protein
MVYFSFSNFDHFARLQVRVWVFAILVRWLCFATRFSRVGGIFELPASNFFREIGQGRLQS